MSNVEIKNVTISWNGNEITIDMQDGSKRTINQPYDTREFMMEGQTAHSLAALVAALLHAYDRIEALERKLGIEESAEPEAS